MTIQTKIKVIILTWVLLVIVGAGMIFLLNRQIVKENNRIVATSDLINDIFQLNILTNDYIINGEDRARSQWLLKYSSIEKLLETGVIQELDNGKGVAASITRNIETLQNVFSQLVRNYQIENVTQVDQAFRLRLIGQLSRSSQDIVSDAFVLSDSSQENIQQLEDITFYVMLALVVMLSAVALGGGYVLLKGVAAPVRLLNEAKAKDEAILESIGDGLLVVNKDGTINRANPTAITLLKTKNIQGKPFWDVVKVCLKEKNDYKQISKEDSTLFNVLNSSKGQEKSLQDNLYINVSSDTYIPVSFVISPIILEKDLLGVVMVFRDITEEASIDSAKSEFVSLASHQLQTPLTALDWSLENLVSESVGSLNAEQKDVMKDITEINARMKELVKGLLNVSRIELGTFMVEPVPTDLRQVADSVLKELEPKIQKRNVTIQKNYSSDVLTIPADQKLLRIVFQNILSNAVKYSKESGNVTININNVKENDQYSDKKILKDGILISISDDGIGIPEKDKSKMFSKLHRAGNAMKQVEEGTGLGLYLVKGIVESSGGQIWFDSQENKGTTFYVTLPKEGMIKRDGSKALEGF